jgi:hypothetical protein
MPGRTRVVVELEDPDPWNEERGFIQSDTRQRIVLPMTAEDEWRFWNYLAGVSNSRGALRVRLILVVPDRETKPLIVVSTSQTMTDEEASRILEIRDSRVGAADIRGIATDWEEIL